MIEDDREGRCDKCGGFLMKDDLGLRCFNCGKRFYKEDPYPLKVTKCVICGREIVTKTLAKKYCYSCSQKKITKKYHTKYCKECGAEFKSKNPKTKYCHKCRVEKIKQSSKEYRRFNNILVTNLKAMKSQ